MRQDASISGGHRGTRIEFRESPRSLDFLQQRFGEVQRALMQIVRQGRRDNPQQEYAGEGREPRRQRLEWLRARAFPLASQELAHTYRIDPRPAKYYKRIRLR